MSGADGRAGRRGLRIGITIGLNSPNESLWINGIKQNALFLAKLFGASPLGHDVALLNTTDIDISGPLPWNVLQIPTFQLKDRLNDLDVLIELGGQIGPLETEGLRRAGTRIVSYCCGPEYVQNIEAMIFRRRLWDSIYINPHYDEIWVIPQIADTTLHFLQTFRRKPARVVPFVWDPCVLNAAASHFAHGGEYRPRPGPKRLTIIEPNIDVMKFCLYPVLIAERAFRQSPERITFLHVANADHLVHDDREFAGLMRELDIVKAQRASFIGRVQTPSFLAEHTDCVISHQWGLPLNYFYLECCWQGYPLVHNAHLVSDLGYYYHANDISEGTEQLLNALAMHDDDWENYRDEQRLKIQRFMAENRSISATYDDLLFNL